MAANAAVGDLTVIAPSLLNFMTQKAAVALGAAHLGDRVPYEKDFKLPVLS